MGMIGCLFGVGALMDLISDDTARHPPVEFFWIGVAPLALSFLLLPFLFSRSGLVGGLKRLDGKLNKTFEEHLEVVRDSQEKTGVAPDDPGLVEYTARLKSLQGTLIGSTDEVIARYRARIGICYAIFGLALMLLLLRIATHR